MARIFGSPGRYVQGKNEIIKLEKHIGKMGAKILTKMKVTYMP